MPCSRSARSSDRNGQRRESREARQVMMWLIEGTRTKWRGIPIGAFPPGGIPVVRSQWTTAPRHTTQTHQSVALSDPRVMCLPAQLGRSLRWSIAPCDGANESPSMKSPISQSIQAGRPRLHRCRYNSDEIEAQASSSRSRRAHARLLFVHSFLPAHVDRAIESCH